MKFECKDISMTDNHYGCFLTLSDEKLTADEQMALSIKEIMNSAEQYLLLQRTYPEDDFEKDFYYYETNDSDKAGVLKDFSIELSRSRFIMKIENDFFDISIHPTDKEYDSLKKLLVRLTNNHGQILINDR